MEQGHVDHSPESQKSRPFLILYSHARRPPLSPAPDLKYDLRGIPNPPKALRDGSDGRSKRLREHLLTEPKFVQKLEAVEIDIRQAMQQKIEEGETTTHQKEQEQDTTTLNSLADADPERKDGEDSIVLQSDPRGDNTINTKGKRTPTESYEVESAILLHVGCYCALGHHRSVAFVHELAQLPWDKEWTVKVHHRDLFERRSGGTRERQKAKFRSRGGEDASAWDMG